MTNRAAFRSKFSRSQPVDPVASLVSSNTAGLAGALRIALTGLETRLGEEFDAINKRVEAVERALSELKGLRGQVARLEAKPDPDLTQPLMNVAGHLSTIGQALEALSARVNRLEARDTVSPGDIADPLRSLATAVRAVEGKDIIGPLKSLTTAVKAVKAPPDRVSKPLGSIVNLIEEIRQTQIDMRREMADRPEPAEREEPELDITELKNVLNQDYEVVRDREGIITGWRPKRG